MYQTKFMRRALELSQQGMANGHGGPFGCVIVKAVISSARHTTRFCRATIRPRMPSFWPCGVPAPSLETFNLAGCELYTNGAPCCMCMSSMLWARIGRVYYVLSMEESRSIGLGDEPFYEELARPLDKRKIIPMIQEPELRHEARAVYELWGNKPDKIQF